MLWGTNMPQEWRSEAAYAYLNDLTPAELAWEFLRRNPEYQRDYRTAADATADQVELPESLITQWGLRFRDQSGSSGGQRSRRLAGASQSKRRSRGAGAGGLQKRRSDRHAWRASTGSDPPIITAQFFSDGAERGRLVLGCRHSNFPALWPGRVGFQSFRSSGDGNATASQTHQ